ncbi:excinuclease ABC subunit UvrA [bacterium]|nr:MAG: excinuclease ABC subunit UvrA [bacterium]
MSVSCRRRGQARSGVKRPRVACSGWSGRRVAERGADPGLIRVRGARQHNLRDVDVDLPRHRLVVITGPSGCGKSSLAFDTIYAEGQRRYLESLSTYARQFLEQVPKPDVDRIEGLSPALAIEQKPLSHNPRSTVGTATELMPFLRLLYARVGKIPGSSQAVGGASPKRILQDIVALAEGEPVTIYAPLLRDRRGQHRALLDRMRKRGFVRVRVDGELRRLEELENLDKGTRHDLDLVIDRLKSGSGKTQRIQGSIETALEIGQGELILGLKGGEERHYSQHASAGEQGGRQLQRLQPRLFSFNTPAGACPACQGLGRSSHPTVARLVPDQSLSIREGALAPLQGRSASFVNEQVEFLATRLAFSLDTAWTELPLEAREAIIEGTQGDQFASMRDQADGHERFLADFEGLRLMIERRYAATRSDRIRRWCEDFMEEVRCPDCDGSRLGPVARSVHVQGQDIASVCALPLDRLQSTLQGWSFSGAEASIADALMMELRTRVAFLVEAGLGYLSLDRGVNTLSGGEGQRIRLATQVAGNLTGALYVLDEPSVGLHPRDTERLITLLGQLRDRGNTVLVVEHDRDLIEASDYVVDMGPGAGEHGGEVVAAGTATQLASDPNSPTGRWLGLAPFRTRQFARPPAERWIRVSGVRARNLRDIELAIPLGRFVVVSGVSGSGKSTAIHEVLHRALARKLHNAAARPGEYDALTGDDQIGKVILIDQRGIGRSPRSTPATFTNLYAHLRKLMAQTPQAKTRGFSAGRFSFNTRGGRCEACSGAGVRTLSMDFLPEVKVRCDDCRGQRFNRQTLEITWKGHNIAQMLGMDVESARELLGAIPPVERILATLEAVGLGYLKLGQRADTLSGGEAQRLKLARELSRPSQGDTLYLLDEPTTGLHFEDVEQLLGVLQRLVDKGNTVVVIEHQPDIIQAADWVIDLGPDGGDQGGEVVVAGPVDSVLECGRSRTGEVLRRLRDA